MPDPDPAEAQLIDLMHLGRARVIGAWRIGDVVVDPGPASALAPLLAELERRPARALALTHIHLDHAGSAGTLVRRFPELEVWVHERGAPHMIDPARLLESATRLYGEQMGRLWGEVVPVPAERVRVLQGGEQLGPFHVAYTPGHATHHVAYLHEPSRRVFAGDVAGVRIGDGPVLAPTPPPDIDLSAWRASLERIEAWRPQSIAVTHFGLYDDAQEQLAALRAQLDRVEGLAAELDEAGYVRAIEALLGEELDADTVASYLQATPPVQGFKGMRRYLQRRDSEQPQGVRS
jgi:glyoxylase-like metal-dependent hydrolase (beta-lactamase superfamily II)